MVSYNEINQQAIQLTQLPAIPCNKDRNFLPLHTKPIPLQPVDATDQNLWHPFDNHLAFDFANFQFVKLQAFKLKINRALDVRGLVETPLFIHEVLHITYSTQEYHVIVFARVRY